MTLTMYGIPNCDSVKKAKQWLAENEVEYEFHDYKKLGIDRETLKAWCKQVGWEILLNRRGTSWRKLTEAERADLTETRAIQLMIANSSLIKRPVLALNNSVMVGFDESSWRDSLLTE